MLAMFYLYWFKSLYNVNLYLHSLQKFHFVAKSGPKKTMFGRDKNVLAKLLLSPYFIWNIWSAYQRHATFCNIPHMQFKITIKRKLCPTANRKSSSSLGTWQNLVMFSTLEVKQTFRSIEDDDPGGWVECGPCKVLINKQRASHEANFHFVW